MQLMRSLSIWKIRKIIVPVTFLVIGIIVGLLIGYMLLIQCYGVLNETLGSIKGITEEYEKLSYSYKLSLILDTIELAQWNSLSAAHTLSLKLIMHKINVTLYDVKPELYVLRVKEILDDRISMFKKVKPPEHVRNEHLKILILLDKLNDEVEDLHKISIKVSLGPEDISNAKRIVNEIFNIVGELRKEIEYITSNL